MMVQSDYKLIIRVINKLIRFAMNKDWPDKIAIICILLDYLLDEFEKTDPLFDRDSFMKEIDLLW